MEEKREREGGEDMIEKWIGKGGEIQERENWEKIRESRYNK